MRRGGAMKIRDKGDRKKAEEARLRVIEYVDNDFSSDSAFLWNACIVNQDLLFTSAFCLFTMHH